MLWNYHSVNRRGIASFDEISWRRFLDYPPPPYKYKSLRAFRSKRPSAGILIHHTLPLPVLQHFNALLLTIPKPTGFFQYAKEKCLSFLGRLIPKTKGKSMHYKYSYKHLRRNQNLAMPQLLYRHLRTQPNSYYEKLVKIKDKVLFCG